MKNTLFLLPLASPLLAQFLSYEDATLAAWKAYGNIIRQYMTAGQALRQGVDFLFITPPTTTTIRGGSPCPAAVTNEDLFPVANSLQNPGEPFLDVQGREYFASLKDYLNSVDLGVAQITDAQSTKLDNLNTALGKASDKFDAEDEKAKAKYAAITVSNKPTFKSWVIANDPLWTAYKRQRDGANDAVQQYTLEVFGPRSDELQSRRDNMLLARDVDPQPGYNMAAYPNPYTVQLSPFNAKPITSGTLELPLYSISGYGEACNNWFTALQQDSSFTWSLSNVKSNDWTEFGHGSSVRQFGGSYYGILGYQQSATSEWTNFTSLSSQFFEHITMELAMKGSPLLFDVGAGYWNVNDVRKVYPKLLPTPKGADLLASKVRLSKILVGYEVGLKITVSDTAVYQNISHFIETGSSNHGGGISIFGFHFGGGHSGGYSRDVSSVKMESTNGGGQIVIAPTPPGMTFLLGAMGKAL